MPRRAPFAPVPLHLAWFVTLSACGASDTASPDASRFEVTVAALELEGVADACYQLEVTRAGAPVWSRGGLCASRYGAGADISYVAPCDGDGAEGAGVLNTVTLRIESLSGPGGAPITDFVDPCAAPHAPSGCQLQASCTPNADTPVRFDLTLMRRAEQGFFDVAVEFDDLFCSAKVDCVDNQGQALRLVHDPASQSRVESVVLAFACTDGDAPSSLGDPSGSTHLYRDAIEIVCGTEVFQVDPSAGPGNVYGLDAPAPLVQAMVFEGAESVVNQATNQDADKLFWNVALGLDTAWFQSRPSGTTCTLRTRMTASQGPLPEGRPPLDAVYPFIAVDLPLWSTGSASTRLCSRHPLDGLPAGVSTSFSRPAPAPAAAAFAYVAARTGSGVATAPLAAAVNECQVGDGPCDANADCTDLAIGFTCVCDEGFSGDGFTCEDIDACEPNPCFAGVACTDLAAPSLGYTCGACPTGYSGDGETCVDTDECDPNPCFTGVSCTDAVAPATGYTCGPCPVGYEGDGRTCTLTPCGEAGCCLDPELCLEDLGDGRDGALVVANATTFNAQTQGSNGRTQPDMVAYRVTELSGANLTTSGSAGLAVGDAVLVINLQSTLADTSHVGHHEARWVTAVGPNSVTLDAVPTTSFGPNGSLLGQTVWVQRIPQYTSVTVNGTLTGNIFGATGTGVLALRSQGQVLVASTGRIDMTGGGWRGIGPASNSRHGTAGNSLAPSPATGGVTQGLPNFGGGGGGKSDCDSPNCTTQSYGAGGGGASFGGLGSAGSNNGALHVGGQAGQSYGDACHTKLLPGSGGGGGAGGVSGPGTAAPGGHGGGVIHLVAGSVSVQGQVVSGGIAGSYNDNCSLGRGSGGGGGGSGGAIVILAETLTVAAGGARITANGGAGACAGGGQGGAGRVKLGYSTLNGVDLAGSAALRASVASPGAACPSSYP